MDHCKLNEFMGAFFFNLADFGCSVEVLSHEKYTVLIHARKGNAGISWAIDVIKIEQSVMSPSILGLHESEEIINRFRRTPKYLKKS